MNTEELIAVGIATKYGVAPRVFTQQFEQLTELTGSSLWRMVNGSLHQLDGETISYLARLWNPNDFHLVAKKLVAHKDSHILWINNSGSLIQWQMATCTIIGVLVNKARFQQDQPQFTV